MALRTIDLSLPLERIEFLVPELIPKGYVTFAGAEAGIGKTMLMTGLAWQMTRPSGSGKFLSRSISQCPVIFLNTDAADGQSRPVRYWLEQHKFAFPDGEIDGITLVENVGSGLSQAEFSELLALAELKQAKCVIIDSFMGTFPGVDSNKLHGVMEPMIALRNFAARTGAAIIITDHLPKKAVGEKAGERGIMGSTGKTAQARAVHLLTRISPKDVDEREVLRWEVRKASFAKSNYALGLEIHRTFDDDGEPTGVHLTSYELPGEDRQNSRNDRATAAVIYHLEGSQGVDVSHAELLALAIKEGGLKERAAHSAVRQALSQLRLRLEVVKQSGRGSPKVYRYSV